MLAVAGHAVDNVNAHLLWARHRTMQQAFGEIVNKRSVVDMHDAKPSAVDLLLHLVVRCSDLEHARYWNKGGNVEARC